MKEGPKQIQWCAGTGNGTLQNSKHHYILSRFIYEATNHCRSRFYFEAIGVSDHKDTKPQTLNKFVPLVPLWLILFRFQGEQDYLRSDAETDRDDARADQWKPDLTAVSVTGQQQRHALRKPREDIGIMC